MSDVKILNRGEKFAHASVGTIRGFEGKQFAKDVMGASSCEISVGTLTEGASVPFFTVIRKMRRIISSSQEWVVFR